MASRIPKLPSTQREFPLSFAQERMWFLHEWYPDLRAYHIHTILRLEQTPATKEASSPNTSVTSSPVCDIAILQYALQKLIQRHSSLRIVFRKSADLPIQTVLWAIPVPLTVDSLIDLPESEREKVGLDIAQKTIQEPFDFIQGPLWRVKVIQQSHDVALLVIVLHHLISDGWSLQNFLQDLLTAYHSIQQKQSLTWPALPIQYTDFAVWQTSFLKSPQGEQELQYWREQLQGELPQTELPYDYPLPAQLTFTGKTKTIRLNPDLSKKIRAFCQQQHVTLFMFLLSVFQIWLKRYTGSRDIIIGTPYAEREAAECQGLIGLLVNTLVLRQRIQGNPKYVEFLQQVKQTTISAYEHSQIPLEWLVREFVHDRVTNRTPLFQVLFAVQNFGAGIHPNGRGNVETHPNNNVETHPNNRGNAETHPNDNDLASANSLTKQKLSDYSVLGPGITITPVPLASQTSKFELSLFIEPTPQQLIISMEYNTALFKDETIATFLQHYQNLLATMIEFPHHNIADFDILSPAQKHNIIEQWNNTITPRHHTNISELLATALSQYPEQVAVIFSRQCTWTYSQLHQQANRLARSLLQCRPKCNLVPIILTRGPTMILAVLAVIKAGLAYVPLSASLPMTRLQHLLQSLSANCLITNLDLLPMVQSLSQDLPDLQHIFLMSHETETISTPLVSTPLLESAPDPNQSLPSTSLQSLESAQNSQKFQSTLSTVPLIHSPRHWQSESDQQPDVNISPDSLAYIIFTSGSTGTPKGVMVNHRTVLNVIQWVNQTFHVGIGDQLLWVTSLGFDLSVYDIFGILATGGTIRCTSQEELQDPSELARIMSHEPITFWDSAPVALQQVLLFIEAPVQQQLRLVFLSGDWIPVSMPDQIRNLFLNAQVISLGGATEATVWSNYFPIQTVSPQWTSIPYGWPIANARYYILDDDLQACPVGVAGDLYIGSECLAIGYFQDPILTAQKFIPDPFFSKSGARMYATGDRAKFWHDGTIEFLGRLDHQVKIRGFRIELAEINTALAQHPNIQDVAVIAHPISRTEKVLIAYWVPKQNLSALNVSGQNVSTQNFATQNVSGQNFTAQDMPTQNSATQNISGQNFTAQNISLPSVASLREFLQKHLPDYMIPSYFISLPKLPMNANGKLERKQLPLPSHISGREQSGKLSHVYDRGSSDKLSHILNHEQSNYNLDSHAPANETAGLSSNNAEFQNQAHTKLLPDSDQNITQNLWEELLLNVWRKFLPKIQIGRNDNFFEIGGHSLLAMQLTAHCRRVFGDHFTIRQLFETPTIASLARALQYSQSPTKLILQDNTNPNDIIPVNYQMPQPLSYYQERFYLLAQLYPESFAYHIPIALQLQGKLNQYALKQAVNQLVQRQFALRTKIILDISPQETSPKQTIIADPIIPITIVDLQESPEATQNLALQNQMAEIFRRPFDLSQDILLRVVLFVLKPEKFVLFLVTHHIACDGSLPILVQELARNYYHYVTMADAEHQLPDAEQNLPDAEHQLPDAEHQLPDTDYLPGLPLQYLDFSAWQKKYLQGEIKAKQIAYWQQQLSNAPVLNLPTDFTRANIFQHHGAILPVVLPISCSTSLQTLSAETGSTLLMLLLTSFALVLQKSAHQNDLVIGTPIQNRPLEMENVIGSFVNTLALRIKMNPEHTLRQIMMQVREQVLTAYQNKDIPLEMLIETIGLRLDLSRTPLFQAMLAWQATPISAMSLPSLEIKSYGFEPKRARFDLLLGLWKQNNQIHGVLEYNQDIFSASTMQTLLDNFQVAVTALCNNIEQKPQDILWKSRLEEQTRPQPEYSEPQPEHSEPQPEHSAPQSEYSKPQIIALRPDFTSTTDLTAMLVEPRDWLEWKIREIWQTILSMNPIGITQHFLDLGGHSLSMARLLLQIRQEFHQEIRLSAFLENSTIEGMANILRKKLPTKFEIILPIRPAPATSAIATSPAATCLPSQPSAATCLPSQPSAATYSLPQPPAATYSLPQPPAATYSLPQPPAATYSHSPAHPAILAIPPAGGHSFCYLELARLLPSWPFYLFQAPGLDPTSHLDYSLSQLATCYINEINRLGIPSPYYLLGWSFGGVVALEMAKQLAMPARQNTISSQQISPASQQILPASQLITSGPPLVTLAPPATHYVIMLDSPMPQHTPTTALTFSQRLVQLARNFQVTLHENELASLSSEDQVQKVLDIAKKQHTLPPDVTLSQAMRWLAVFQHHEDILQQYEPTEYHGPVMMIHPVQSNPNNKGLGFQKYCSCLLIKEVSATHFTLLQQPIVQQTADMILSLVSC